MTQINMKRTAIFTPSGAKCPQCGKPRKIAGREFPLYQFGYRDRTTGTTTWMETAACSHECAAVALRKGQA